MLRLVFGMTQGTLVASHEKPACEISKGLAPCPDGATFNIQLGKTSSDESTDTLGFLDLLRQANLSAETCSWADVKLVRMPLLHHDQASQVLTVPIARFASKESAAVTCSRTCHANRT